MSRNWIRLFWVMPMLAALVACGSTEVQPQPTHTLVPDSTSSPEPTSTLEPTHTPLPTDTPQPTKTLVPTPLPTATFPPPDSSLEGILFLDANGSGLQDEASFICPEPEAAPPSLAYFFPESAGCNPGEMITVIEPGLSGIVVKTRVNDGWISTLTEADGSYQLLIPEGIDGRAVKIDIEDPNEDEPALAMKYFNQWTGPVIVPAATIEGVELPEQQLNDTKLYPLNNGGIAVVGQVNRAGLTQGFLTLPFHASSFGNNQPFVIWNGYDICGEPYVRDGVVYNISGHNLRGNEYSNPPIPGQIDGHAGLDITAAEKTVTVAAFDGITNNITRADGEITTFLSNEQFRTMSTYGHLYSHLTESNQKVIRGEIIALTGHTGGDPGSPTDQLHFDTAYWGDNAYFIPYGISDLTLPSGCIPGDSDPIWTVYNLPFFSANSM